MELDKKSIILEAVEQIITYKRFHEVKVEDIATKAGVGKGTIYRYFKDKDHLFFELAIYGFDPFTERLTEIVSSEKSFNERLTESAYHLESFFKKRHNTMRSFREHEERIMTLEPERKKIMSEKKESVDKQLTNLFSNGQNEGYITKSVSAEILAIMFIEQLIGRLHWPMRVEKPSVEEMLKLLINGIGI
ncbi:MAG: TetR/AcrR family transcriptional regulator [Candidatus Delongbacteria bacterium]|nr:TetR/AcrR family transcriptional regulator [Candidatus Delongbacteria bacterium]MBN2836925.1 TetR/AcrR family transcriptional regulator [Candidatus Delongbacteria bacterium]